MMRLNLSKENKSKILFMSLMVLAIIVSVASIYASEANNSSAVDEAPVGLTGGLSHHVDLTKMSENTVANDSAAASDNDADKTVANDSVVAADNECLSKMSDNAMAYDTVKVSNNNRLGKVSDQYIAYEPADFSSDKIFTMSEEYVVGTDYHWIVSDETYGVDLVSVNNTLECPEHLGSIGTTSFNFHINSDDYYVKLLFVDSEGDVIRTIDSNS